MFVQVINYTNIYLDSQARLKSAWMLLAEAYLY